MGNSNSHQQPAADLRYEKQLVVAAFARIHSRALGVSVGVVSGLILFAATSVLLVAEAIEKSGHPVGTHLGLLDQFLPGYSVTWPGTFVGLAYGFLIGFLMGAVLGKLLNFSHYAYVKHVQRKLRAGVMHDAL